MPRLGFRCAIMPPRFASRNQCDRFRGIFLAEDTTIGTENQAVAYPRCGNLPVLVVKDGPTPSTAAGGNKQDEARTLRARALVALKKPSDAMADLDQVLKVRPGFADALALRGIAWSEMREYDKAREDLDRAISQKETVENYFARAKVHEAQNNLKKATDDYRRATELKPASVFDVLAQAELKRKIQELSKRLPCGSHRQTGTCL